EDGQTGGLSRRWPKRRGWSGQKGVSQWNKRKHHPPLCHGSPMSIVPPLERLASASAVFFGQRGAVTRDARQRGLSRPRPSRQAHGLLHALGADRHRQQLAQLHDQLALLQRRVQPLQDAQRCCVHVSADLLAQFAATAQAEGVSLPVARRLLAVFQGDATPSVAQLGRYSHQAARRASALLEVFDEQARPRARQAAADEIFFGARPVLMVVAPHSQCWLSARLSPRRDAVQWAKELEALTNLEHLVRDGAKGIENGLARVNAAREGSQEPAVSDQLDHFHTLREGRRALGKSQAKAER